MNLDLHILSTITILKIKSNNTKLVVIENFINSK